MPTCQQCNAELPVGRKRFCSNECGVQFHNERRKPSSEAHVVDVETRPIDQTAHRLVIEGYLPAPFICDAHDQRPLWDFSGLALMLDQRPDELVQLLVRNGHVHLEADRGIPSSWQSIVRMTL